MKPKKIFALLIVLLLISALVFVVYGNRKPSKPFSPVLASVSGYDIMTDEFEEGFSTSAFAARSDRLQARREYLETVINQKLILLDAQKKNIDKAPDFLKSVERFWAQSLLTVALGQKTLELQKGVNVREEDVRRIYESMVKDGVTEKPFEDVYPQIKWQAEKQIQTQRLNAWVESLRKGAVVNINDNVLKALK
jgi:hypothetical protein